MKYVTTTVLVLKCANLLILFMAVDLNLKIKFQCVLITEEKKSKPSFYRVKRIVFTIALKIFNCLSITCVYSYG